MNSQLEIDEHYMLAAINLATKGEYTTTPNPNVGCVLVQDDHENGHHVIGQGWHQKAGEGHAEVNALAEVSVDLQGATAYVTLEPCSHHGKTGPCAQALIDAGISRVVIAMQDPNPLVSGNGIDMLERAGIDTEVGVLEDRSKNLNLGFIKRMVTGYPRVTCKLASSLDGRTAMANGQSKWITSSTARKDVQQFRAKSCAIISGADTVLIDDAKLNVRYDELGSVKSQINEEQLRQPVRVIIDSQCRLTPDLALFSIESPIIIIRTTLENEPEWPHFVKVIQVKSINDKVDLNQLLLVLGSHGHNNVWLESGARLSGAFLAASLVDELILYQAPKLMADQAKGLFTMPDLVNLSDAVSLSFSDVRMIGPDLRITALIDKN